MTAAELRAVEMYNRTAAAQGFTNAPWWNELNAGLRATWIAEAKRKWPDCVDAQNYQPKD